MVTVIGLARPVTSNSDIARPQRAVVTIPSPGVTHHSPPPQERDIGRIRLSVSTVNRTYELSGITHVTSFRKYGKHSTAPSTYGPWVRTCSKLFSCKSVLTVCSYRAQSNEIHTYARVSRGSIPRVSRYGLLYLRTVEYDQCGSLVNGPPALALSISWPHTSGSQCIALYIRLIIS